MGKPRYTAKAQDIAHKKSYMLSGFSDGDGVKLTINSKFVQVFYDSELTDTFVEQVVDAWNSATAPEIAEITASVDADDETVLVLTHDTPGWEFELSYTVTNATNNSNVVESVKGSPIVNEVQKLELIGTYSGGTFTYTNDFGSGDETTAAIAYNATAATVQAAILALATPVSGDLAVSGAAGGPWFLTWQGNFEATEVAEGTVDGSSLTGNAAIQVTTLTTGRGLSDEVQQIFVAPSASAYQFRLTFGGQVTGVLDQDDTAATIQTALEALSTIGSGNIEIYGGDVDYTTNTGKVLYAKFVGSLAGTDVGLISVDGSHLFGCSVTISPIVAGGAATANELQLVNLGQPTAGTWTLSDGTSTTPAMPYNEAPGDVEVFLESFSAFDGVEVYAPNVSVGSPPGVYLIEFQGSQADTKVNLLTLGVGSLTYDTTPTIEEIRIGEASVNEVQSIIIGGSGGTFTLTFDGQTTSSLTHGDSAATVDTALEALSNIGSGDVSVSGAGTPASPYLVTFTGALATTDVAEITGDASSLTGGAGQVTETTAHSAAVDEQQVITIDPSATGGEFRLLYIGDATSWIAYDAAASTVESALEALTGIPGVTVSGSAGGPYTVTFDTGAVSEVDVDLLVIDASRLTLSGSGESVVETLVDQATGKNWWNNTDNWENLGSAPIPEFGDEADIDIGDDDNCPKFGIRQRSTFTADASTDFVTFAGADFVEDQKIQLTTTDTLPAGLSTATDYYILNWNRESQTAQLSTSRGGSAVNITGTGTGTHTAKVVLARLYAPSSFEGEIGLPETNEENEDYNEYRPEFLLIGITELVIGGGEGAGTSGMRIELGDDDTMTLALIQGTGNAQGNEQAVTLQGGTITQISWNSGSLGIAPKKRVDTGNSCVVTTLRQGYRDDVETDTDLYVGEEATIATLIKTGGNAEIHCPITTLARNQGGETNYEGDAAVAQLTVQGGEWRHNSTGAIGGNTVVSGDGHLDFSQDLRAKTVTNPIERYGEDSQISDPHGVVSSLVIDNNETEDLSNLRIGQNVRVTRGAVA